MKRRKRPQSQKPRRGKVMVRRTAVSRLHSPEDLHKRPKHGYRVEDD